MDNQRLGITGCLHMKEDSLEKLLLDNINDVLFRVHNSYLVRREIHLHLNATVNRTSSKAYLALINKYSGFFLPLLDSSQAYVITHLNRLVSSSDARSLEKVINKMSSIGKTNFMDDLIRLRTANSNILAVITNYRMNTFAHLGIIEENGANSISEKEYIALFKDIKSLMNKLNSEYNSEFYYEADKDNDSILHTHIAIQKLLEADLGLDEKQTSNNIEYLYLAGRKKWFEQ